MKTLWDYVKLVLGFVLIGTVLVFTAQNAEAVQVRFLGWSFESSLSLVIFLVLAVGLLSGFLLTEWFRWRGRKRSTKETNGGAGAA
ncbi:MAG TPA: LapA family protein [Vicinamibacteria bacterium]|jgi:uncharacterized integral membrane protein